MLGKIAQCNPEQDGPALTKEINSLSLRHIDLEEIRDAFTKRKAWQEANATDEEKARKFKENIAQWRAGRGGAFLNTDNIMLRVFGEQVQCTNGNSISLATARTVLPVILDRRHANENLSLPLDSYRVERVSAEGVKIGCTLVPWEEVELLQKLL